MAVQRAYPQLAGSQTKQKPTSVGMRPELQKLTGFFYILIYEG